MENTITKNLRVVVFQERNGSAWVSQCIEYDLNGQGSSAREAIKSIARVLATQATLDIKDGIDPFSRLDRAESKYEEMFEDSLELKKELPVSTTNWQRNADLRIHA